MNFSPQRATKVRSLYCRSLKIPKDDLAIIYIFLDDLAIIYIIIHLHICIEIHCFTPQMKRAKVPNNPNSVCVWSAGCFSPWEVWGGVPTCLTAMAKVPTPMSARGPPTPSRTENQARPTLVMSAQTPKRTGKTT